MTEKSNPLMAAREVWGVDWNPLPGPTRMKFSPELLR